MPIELTDLQVSFISLCKKGKNGFQTLYKEEDGTVELPMLMKADGIDEKGELTVCVYAPEKPDSESHWASAEEIKKALYKASKEGVNIDIQHDGHPLGRDKIYSAERFVIQKGDPRFSSMKDYKGNPVDVTGGWGEIFKVESEELRKECKSGKWNGVSLFGKAKTRVPASAKKSEDPEKLLAEDSDVALSKEEIQELIKGAVSEGVAAGIKASREIQKIEPQPVKKAQISSGFSGDPTSLKDVQAHFSCLKKAQLMTSVDWTDAEQVLNVVKALQETEQQAPRQTDREISLEKELRTLRSRSNILPVAKSQKSRPEHYGMDSDELKQWGLGASIAEQINKQSGYTS